MNLAIPFRPRHDEKEKLEAVRRELTSALERATEVLKSAPTHNHGLSRATPAHIVGRNSGKGT
jgi:hypothetical protein